MRILYVCLDRGIVVGAGIGGAVHIAGMVDGWRSEGHDVEVLARRATPGTDHAGCGALTRSVGRLRGPGVGEASELALGRIIRRRVRAAIEDFRPDVIYERYALFRTEVSDAAAAAYRPHVLEVNAPLAEEARRFRSHRLTGVAASRERQAWRSADLVVVPSAVMAERVRAAGQPDVLVAPNGVRSVDRFTDSREQQRIRSSLGLTDRFVVGWVGSMMPWHDLTTVVSAVGGMSEAVRPSLLVVGDGAAREEAVAVARRAGVQAVFTGRVPHHDVPALLSVMDACVCSLAADEQLRYFAPLKAMEYLAAGKPTVVAATGDLRGLVDSGAALGYPPGDIAALSERLSEIASDPRLRSRLGAAGLGVAADNTWPAIGRRVLAAVEALDVRVVGRSA